jgi:hypothetical protein
MYNICPRCTANNNELTSFPIMANESFTFDHNPKRGIEFEFKPRQKTHFYGMQISQRFI